MHIRIIYSAIFLILLCACNEPNGKDDFEKFALLDSLSHLVKGKMDQFKFPDSIDRSSIIASFYEVHALANSVIVYTDKEARLAKLVRYFPDGSALWEHLKQVNDQEFVSLTNLHGTFILKDSTITHSLRRDLGLAYSYEHRRTDKK